jgi:hypothetical protein
MRYFRDPWIQIFGFLALASGALAAFGVQSGPSPRPVEAESAGPAAAVPAPAAAPGPAALRPKIAGKWVVDAALASDADTANLADALAAAAAGDTVYVRAGTYLGRFSINRDVELVGLGERGAVGLTNSSAGPALVLDSAKVAVKNITIIHSGDAPGKGVESRRARMELVGVAIKVGPQDVGLDVIGGEAAVVNGTIDGGRKAADAHDDAKLRLERVSLDNAETGLLVEGASAELVHASFTDDKNGLTVSEQGSATVVEGDFVRDAVGLWASRGGRIAASSTRFSYGATGIRADDGGRVENSSGTFTEITGSALRADSAEIDDAGSAIYMNKDSAVSAQGRATLTLRGTRIESGAAGAVVLLDGASAVLSRAVISRNAGFGLSVRGAHDVRVENSTISGQARCAVEIYGSALTLVTTWLTQNLCGVSFLGRAVLDSDSSTFTGNKEGPFIYLPSLKNEIVVRGKNNDPRNLASLIQ